MQHSAAVETELFRDLLRLVEVMTVDQTADGMPRQPGLVILSTLGAVWVCEVIDRHNGVGFASMSITLDEAVAQANDWLQTGKAPWSKLKRRDRAV